MKNRIKPGTRLHRVRVRHAALSDFSTSTDLLILARTIPSAERKAGVVIRRMGLKKARTEKIEFEGMIDA